MATRSDTEGPVIEFARLLLGVINELAERAHRQRWVYDQSLRADAKTGDGHKIFDRVVRQLAVGVRRGDEGGVGGHQQRVAIGRGSGDVLGADLAGAAARLVLDHYLLTPGLREPLCQRAADYIGDAAGRKRHDDVNGLDGVGLRP